MKLVSYKHIKNNGVTYNGQQLVSGKFSTWYKKKEKELPSIIVTHIFYDVDIKDK